MAAHGVDDGPPRLDIARVARRLGLEKRARENARRELPRSDDDQLDDPQRQVVAYVRGEADRICTAYEASLAALNQRIRILDVGKRLRALKRAPIELTRQLRELAARVELGFLEADGEHVAVEAEYAAFRAQHRIQREPRYPASRLAPVALLLAVAVAKAGLAAHLFDQDLVTVGRAVLLVSVDMSLTFVLGRSVPRLAGRRWVDRLAGGGAALGLAAWVFGFNLLAHLTGASNPWIWTGLGVALSAGAALIGACSDDRYPGYGPLHRRLARARSQRDYWKTIWLEAAASLHARHQARINTAAAGVGQDLVDLEATIEAKSRLLREIRDFVRQFENAANALLRLYRDTNVAHRSTRPPAYFERIWRLHISDQLVDTTDDDIRRLYEARRIGASANDMAVAARARARAIYTEFVRDCRANGSPEEPARSRCA